MKFEQKCHTLDNKIRELKQAKGLCFVLCDKFWDALRNSIHIIPNIAPDIIVSERWGRNVHSWCFILERNSGIIGDRHYLGWKQLNSEISRLVGNRRLKFFSWIPREELGSPSNFLCTDNSTRYYVEDKTNLKFILSQAWIDADVFTLKHNIFASKEDIPDFATIVDAYGLPFVVQWWSKWWDGTIIVRDSNDFNKINKLVGKIRISEFCDKQYGSIYACIMPPDQNSPTVWVIMDRPAFKVVGVSSHGIRDVFWWGCNWWQMPDIDLEETRLNVTKIWLYLWNSFWYTWSLVLEWFFIEGRFVFNEINARLWWGNEVSGFNQILNEQIPIQAIHYALKLWIPCSNLINKSEFHERHFDESSRGCFYFKLLWKEGREFRVWTLSDWPHSFDQGRLVWIEGHNILPTQTSIKDWHIYISNLPRSSTLCSKDAHICMIEGVSDWKNVLVPSPTQVSWLILQISNLVYNNLVYA